MEQPGAAAASGAGGSGEEPGGGRSNKRSAGNRAANEEETKNKPKLKNGIIVKIQNLSNSYSVNWEEEEFLIVLGNWRRKAHFL
ncbi:hypothetical protein FD755_023366 [Muntiacus reevesi]|uniref:Uncharacterized protein n=1 Tax=Muntiacus reevesi TaxID=9886 RepID=A0A5N3W0P7_MUNRE|nr:hypothetical protein FD755_023366 [Muntiacus reevesi]